MAEETPRSILALTPFNPTFQENPHALLEPLRRECPVMRDDAVGSFFISKYSDVRAMLADRTLWRDPLKAAEGEGLQRNLRQQRQATLNDGEENVSSILLLDDPDHARTRGPLAQAFYARVAKYRPQTTQIVDEILNRLEGQETFDLMSTFCVPIPIDVIASILGVDRARLAEFRDWSEGVIQSLNPFRTDEQTAYMERSGEALRAYFMESIADRRVNPKDDLITDMVKLQADGAAQISDVELQVNLGALLVGGNLTTTDLIGNGVRLFLQNPGELAKLRADPSLINGAVEEILRYEPPIDITGRVASRDLEVQGCPIKQTQSIMFSLRGSNRDPEVMDDPDTFNITRKHVPHNSFGGGAHICIGAPLARLEAQVAIPRLFERFPNLRLANPDEPATWRTLPFFRGLAKLELRA